MSFVLHSYINPTGAFASDVFEAIDLNNQALALTRQGDHAGAEVLHKKALKIKERAHGPDATQTALTLNALGEVQYELGKYDEAETNLRRAVTIRNGSAANSLDAAVSRENLAQVLEAKGHLREAKETRDSGKPNSIACGHSYCPGATFNFSQLQACPKCHCVYYCSAKCKQSDSARHTPFCKETEL
ncbi:hypothetical protein M422DRAFT_781615 [Sphaerobolus stellatus SS14]|uniref:MYND-type domain-containing protein n=1 Tax=Sphaerobolus stellatus (strain SS14) TaxID=990650 RepID=A0A0C9V857_SPHS4|nr:hypothetical protein M422DRAFT_781615 [Sphaerobolus stellatus SS14]